MVENRDRRTHTEKNNFACFTAQLSKNLKHQEVIQDAQQACPAGTPIPPKHRINKMHQTFKRHCRACHDGQIDALMTCDGIHECQERSQTSKMELCV